MQAILQIQFYKLYPEGIYIKDSIEKHIKSDNLSNM
jgi:hypothetical protein